MSTGAQSTIFVIYRGVTAPNGLLAAISFEGKRALYEMAQICTNRCRTRAGLKLAALGHYR